MTLDTLFTDTHAINRHRAGPLGTYQDNFCQWMRNNGYSCSTMRSHITYLTRFGEYLSKHPITDFSLIHQAKKDFLKQKDLPVSRVVSAYGVNCFIRYLRQSGNLVEPEPPDEYRDLMTSFRCWLCDYRGASSATIKLRENYLRQFLEQLKINTLKTSLAQYTHDSIQHFFLEYALRHGVAARRSMQATLRCFLQYCYIKGMVTRDLSSAVPTLRTYKLATLPRSIPESDALKIFNNFNRDTKTGKRDYAILRLLYHYGLRNEQVRTLRLQDVDWRQEIIRLPALKHGNPVVIPLVEEVAESLLDYLQNSRPQYPPFSEVFLTIRAPHHPFSNHSTLSEIVSRYLRCLSLKPPSMGARVYRHGFATRMLKQGNSLKSIADVLGHRSLETTTIYTKVDFNSLQHVPLELPAEEVL
jgi:integrase/recombinase XerD